MSGLAKEQTLVWVLRVWIMLPPHTAARQGLREREVVCPESVHKWPDKFQPP